MSVKCHKCGLFNSFSFSTNQTRCIKCNTRLDKEDVLASQMHLDNLNNRDFKNINKSWNRIDDTYTITGNKG